MIERKEDANVKNRKKQTINEKEKERNNKKKVRPNKEFTLRMSSFIHVEQHMYVSVCVCVLAACVFIFT